RIECGWRSIERHLDIAGRAPRRECPCARGKAFPVRTPWLIEMHMGIDDARENMEPLGIDLLFACPCEVWCDGNNVTIGHSESGATFARRGHHRAIAHKQVILAHSYPSSSERRLRNRSTTLIATATSSGVTDSAGLWLIPPRQRTKSMPISVSSAST